MSHAYRRHCEISFGAIYIFIYSNQVSFGRYLSFVGSIHALCMLVTVPALRNRCARIRTCLGLLDFLENLKQKSKKYREKEKILHSLSRRRKHNLRG